MAPVASIAVDSGTVLILITLAVLPIAAFSFARSGGAWRQIGKGPLSIEQELPPRLTADGPEPPVDRRVQEAEARQMLEAKADRRRRRGEPPIDVEAELRRLLDGAASGAEARHDAELRAEIRRLAIARNERRVRRGEAPLDVEAEIERELQNLVGSGP